MYVYQRIAIELEDTGDTVYYHSELDTSKSFSKPLISYSLSLLLTAMCIQYNIVCHAAALH